MISTWRWILYHFLYICMFVKFSILKNGADGLSPPFSFVPLNPPFQLSMHHVSSCLWQYPSFNLAVFSAWKIPTVINSQGNCHFHWEASSHSYSQERLSLLDARGSFSVKGLYFYYCKYYAPVSLFISPADSKHFHKWDNNSSIFCLIWPLALCLA